MNDQAILPFWISADGHFSINFSKVATTRFYADTRSTVNPQYQPANPVPMFYADELAVSGDCALSAFAAFKKFHGMQQ